MIKRLLQGFRSPKQLVIASVALVLLVASTLVVTQRHKPTAANSPVITNSTSTPSETKPDKAAYDWQGSADEPKYITMPSIKAEGFIQKAGVDQHNEIAVPNNIYMAAWFNRSAKPGAPGLSIIDGHVNGRVEKGIFKDLTLLKVGDQFDVTLGNDQVKHYKVVSIQTVPVADAVNVLFSQEPTIKSQLNLITCGGKFNRQTHSYDSRVIAAAALVN